jgi:hypothetical protein
MPISPIYDYTVPLSDVRTYDGRAPYAQHTHVYLDRAGPPEFSPKVQKLIGKLVDGASAISPLDAAVRRRRAPQL